MSFLKKLFGAEETEADRVRRNFETLRDDGVRALRMGEADYAERCLRSALELSDDDAVVGLLAEVLLRKQDYAAAVPLLRRLAEKETESVEVRLHLALAQGRSGDYESMRQTCADLAATHADEPRVGYFSAQAAHGLHDDFSAIAHLTQALALRPDYADALQLRASILADMGQFREVLDDAARLVEMEADNADYLLLQARALAATGQTDEAVAVCEKVRLLDPFRREAVLLLGATYEQTNRCDMALALYDEAIELQPDFAEAYRQRGGVKHRLHDDAGAAEDLKKSLELKPESVAELDGEYTNVENRMAQYYRNLNPYGF